MTQREFDAAYDRIDVAEQGGKELLRRTRAKLTPAWLKKRLLRAIPILAWLPAYDWKSTGPGDLIGGLTVGVMHVPQGMAYATLAGVPPIQGLYSSFFGALVYMFFGTSRHISVGVFAVASIMVGGVRFKLGADVVPGPVDYTTNEMLSTLTLSVGLVQLVMGTFRLSFLASFISDPLIAGYTTATALHVLISQLNKVIGVQLSRHSGNGMIVEMFYDVISNVKNANPVTTGISAFSLVFLYIGKEYINPLAKKRSPVPVPFDLILIVIAIIVSTVFGLSSYGVKIVGHIPRGFPTATLPRLDLLSIVFVESIPIAIICYMFVISLGKVFAKKHGYKIDCTQEFFALGWTEVISSVFPVYPVGGALSRSSVCESSGVNSPLYTVYSSALLCVVILWIGPWLEPLPMCILSCIVIVSLKSLLLQVRQLPALWVISKHDFAVFLVSMLTTIFTTVTNGLLISMVFVLLCLALQQQRPVFDVLGRSDPRPVVFRPLNRYTKLLKAPRGCAVVKFEAPLHFASVTTFTEKLVPVIEGTDDSLVIGAVDGPLKSIVFDCSAMAFIDSMGLDALLTIFRLATEHKIEVMLTNVSENIISVFDKSDAWTTIPQNCVFTTNEAAIEALEHTDTLQSSEGS